MAYIVDISTRVPCSGGFSVDAKIHISLMSDSTLRLFFILTRSQNATADTAKFVVLETKITSTKTQNRAVFLYIHEFNPPTAKPKEEARLYKWILHAYENFHHTPFSLYPKYLGGISSHADTHCTHWECTEYIISTNVPFHRTTARAGYVSSI